MASFNGAPPPVPFIATPALPPEHPPSFTITFTPSFLPPPQVPTAVISIRHQRNYFFMRHMPEGTHVEEHTFSTQPRRFPVPLLLLLTRSLWEQTASRILSHFIFSSEAHALLLSDLYIYAAAWAEDAFSHGFTRLDVAVDVRERIEFDFPPLVPTFVYPASMAPLEEASVGQNMKLKELSEIAAGETCAVCLEEFGGSTKAVTETPCSHLFHTDCLFPWLSRATTCPLCRSSL